MYNILCVDNTQANVLVLESLLESYRNKYNIFTASSSHEALGILLNQNIDLVLFNVIMPQLDAFQTAKLIKANKQIKDIPIIFLAEKKDEKMIENAFIYGVDYLSKPYDEFELLTRIEIQLKLAISQKQLKEQVSFGQSVLDSQQNIIFIEDNDGLAAVNKTFLNFFNIKNIDEFNLRYKSISDLFMEYENYFSLHILNDGVRWCDKLSSQSNDKEYNVLIMNINTFEPKAFRINVNEISNTDKFVVSLTDITELTVKSKSFEIKATYDVLTNIFNRSKFNELIVEHYNLYKRYKKSLSFAIFDIDFFKKVNDTYGHVIGDEVLITFTRTIDDATRDTDIFARWGGEEFVLLMPETSMDEAKVAVDHLRILIEKAYFKKAEHITCSVGVTQFNQNDTIDTVIIRADDALYEAKETGRNKVCTK